MAKCGYTDPMPYWNWSLDGDDWFGSPIWSNSSFGGNGNATNGYCISTGPYADIQLTYPMNHCLYRDLNLGSDAQEYISPAYLTAMNAHDNYIDFNWDLIFQPHNLVHFSVNGEMLQKTSPNDPVFWVHHANIDRLWTLWQGRNQTRLIDYGGNTVQGQGSNDSSKYPLATLQDTVNMMGIAGMPNLTVADTMDTLAGPFCYTYDA